MKQRVLETLALLTLVVLLWGMAAWVRYVADPATTTSQVEIDRVQTRVQTVLRFAAQDADRALKRVRQFPRAPFSAPLPTEVTACVVLRRDSLVYWSDHSLVSDVDPSADQPGYRAIDTRQGKRLVVSRTSGPYRALAYIPVESKYGISNRYLTTTLNRDLFGLLRPRLIIDEKALLPQIRAADGTYLFSLAPDTTVPAVADDPDTWLPLALLLAGIGFWITAWWRMARTVRRYYGAGPAAVVILLPLTLLRAVLLWLNLPFALAEIPLFDPKYYAASWLAPSLGDQLLNAGLEAVAAWLLLRWFRRRGEISLKAWRRRLSPLMRMVGALLMLGLMGALLWYRYQVYMDIFANSQLDLDVTQSVKLTWLKLLLAVLLVVHSSVAGVALFVLTSTGSELLPGTLRGRVWRLLLAGEMAAWVGAFWLGSHLLALVALTLLFAKGVLVVRERQRARGVSYPQTVFLFAAVALWALVGALAQKRHYDRQLRAAEQRLASSLLVEHDVLSEFLLEEVAEKIAADPLVRRTLTGPFQRPDIARQKIVKYYLRDYFTQYETGVRFFDGAGHEYGIPVQDTANSLGLLRRRLGRFARPTEHVGLWLLADARTLAARRYVKVMRLPEVARVSTAPPTIVLELSLKKLNPYSVVPELLVDQKYAPPTGPAPTRPFSYAVFGPAGLVASEGEVDYSGWGPNAALMKTPGFYADGLTNAGFHHVGRKAGPRTTLVLSTPAYTAGDVLSNFSFLFLLHLLATTAGVTVVILAAGRRRTTNRLQASLSTKIQVLLNVGTLVPLLVVSAATVAISTSASERDLVAAYQQRGARVQQNLMRAGRYTQARAEGREALTELANDVADLSETDVLLFDPGGQLLTSSQPLLFETGALSKIINPAAVAALHERGQPRVLLPEHAGLLTFNALYLPVPDPAAVGISGRVAGYIGIPFFNSAQALDTKLTELVTTMMNIFTLMFIVFVLITFIASRVLTAPLKLLAQKLKYTSLTSDQNERLAYEAPDEIGLLVGEYNQMLAKLEASRQELATRTQEAAWREMARQVAHEIKNPLTPMKLSLQYLQRVVHDGRQNAESVIDKVSQTLITQIDTLSDIASSFSSFTSLPEPRPERVDLLALLRHCLDLHPGTANTPVDTELPEAWIMADRSLLVRTFNNLLINALQSIPDDRVPLVRATVGREGDAKVRVGIHDNGAGIPEAVRPKVFVPNFSTKFSGSGIGLAVAKRAVEGAGGQLWFDTTETEGTTFWLTLPLAEPGS